jgi:hypothetical protein
MRSSRKLSPAAFASAFLAGVIAVLVFHQGLFALLHLAGIIPIAPYSMTPTRPFGVPEVASASFWGGVWAMVFLPVVKRRFEGRRYWVAAFVFGAVALTAVYAFVVSPLKTGGLPVPLLGVLVVGALLNGAWGIGTALFLDLLYPARRSFPRTI